MTRELYFQNLLTLFTELIEENDIEKENQVQKRIEAFVDDTYLEGRDVEKTIKSDLREISHYYGGWDELKKVITQLEDNDNEDAFERSCNEPEAWDGGFADNH